jgi:transcriptional regulator with XRE-family HTH domain
VATVGERLKEERLLRGWSQRDLARESGTTAETISSIETGLHEPRPSTLRKLAEGLGIEVRDFYAEPALPKAEAPRGAGLSLLEKALNAARQDEEKTAQAINRLAASEGVLPPGSYVIEHEEDSFRAELRRRGFPDEYFESFVWPLVIKAVRADGLEEENARLEEENAVLRKRAARVE